MKSAMLAIFSFALIGFFAFLYQSIGRLGKEESVALADSVAVNFLICRNAAYGYALLHPEDGEIALAAMSAFLPAGYAPARAWRIQVRDAFLYVWGPASEVEIGAARELVRFAADVGMADNGAVVPRRYATVPLPAFVPAGSLVSVMGLGTDTQDPGP